jgi:hypothetical protein
MPGRTVVAVTTALALAISLTAAVQALGHPRYYDAPPALFAQHREGQAWTNTDHTRVGVHDELCTNSWSITVYIQYGSENGTNTFHPLLTSPFCSETGAAETGFSLYNGLIRVCTTSWFDKICATDKRVT